MRDPRFFWPDGTPKSRGNAFDWRTWAGVVDFARESAGARGGAKSAETKRARGQELVPRLHLKGSKPRLRTERDEALA